jgi:hypothetical protein
MDIDKLRALVKEEVQNALVEHGMMGMDLTRFRREVGTKLGRDLNEGEAYDETWIAWHDLIKEGGQHPDAGLVDVYVEYAVKLLGD